MGGRGVVGSFLLILIHVDFGCLTVQIRLDAREFRIGLITSRTRRIALLSLPES